MIKTRSIRYLFKYFPILEQMNFNIWFRKSHWKILS